jgi:Cu(I)/Ag(I) efflux system periplasmic protein CusF
MQGETMMKAVLILATTLGLGAPAVLAQTGHAGHGAATKAAAPSAALTDGEIRRVDKEAKKITIKHGPIKNLDMPAMTMVFQATDPALLDKVKAGDKVKFQAEKKGDNYLVTRIEK